MAKTSTKITDKCDTGAMAQEFLAQVISDMGQEISQMEVPPTLLTMYKRAIFAHAVKLCQYLWLKKVFHPAFLSSVLMNLR